MVGNTKFNLCLFYIHIIINLYSLKFRTKTNNHFLNVRRKLAIYSIYVSSDGVLDKRGKVK